MSFCLLLKLHTPIILARVVPRLDTLLAEAASRVHLDWQSQHDLPLIFDDVQGGYRASQLLFGVTSRHGLVAEEVGMISAVNRLPLAAAGGRGRPIRIDGGPMAPKLTRHQGLLSPFLVFYGDGDGEACAALLSHLSHIGLEHARGQGAFTVAGLSDDPEGRWRQRPWRTAAMHAEMPYQPIKDQLCMSRGGREEPVHRPPRILREALG